MASKADKDLAVMVQSAVISGLILSLLWLAATWLLPKLIDYEWQHASNLETGVKLFALWLVTTSTIRSLDKLRRGIQGWKLVITGVGLVVGATLLFFLTGYIWKMIVPETSLNWGGLKTGPFFIVVGFVVSVVSMINLKVKNTFLGNVLELLFIGLIAFLFFYYL